MLNTYGKLYNLKKYYLQIYRKLTKEVNILIEI